MILTHVSGDVPGRCPGQHQQGVDHQQAHPGHGDGHDHSDGGGKQGFLPENLDAAAVRQGRMDRGEHELIEGTDP